MISIHSETMRLLKAAAKRLPGDPHLCTVFRWTKKGIRGVRLEATNVGGRWFTSDEAIGRFLARLNSNSDQMEGNLDANRVERTENALKEVFGE